MVRFTPGLGKSLGRLCIPAAVAAAAAAAASSSNECELVSAMHPKISHSHRGECCRGQKTGRALLYILTSASRCLFPRHCESVHPPGKPQKAEGDVGEQTLVESRDRGRCNGWFYSSVVESGETILGRMGRSVGKIFIRGRRRFVGGSRKEAAANRRNDRTNHP